MLSKLKLFFIIISFSLVAPAYAQSPILDSLTHHYDSLAKVKTNKIDSSNRRINNKIDSAQLRLNSLLNPNLNVNQLASKLSFNKKQPLDSVAAVHELDSLKRGLTYKIDSLKQLNLPTEKYTHKLDSLKALSPTRYVQLAQSRAGSVNSNVNKNIGALEDKINKPIANATGKVNGKLAEMRSEGGDKANLPPDINTKVDLPDADLKTTLSTDKQLLLPGTDIKTDNPLGKVDNPLDKQLKEVSDAKAKVNEVKSAPQNQVNKLKSSDEAKVAQEKLNKANAATDKAQSYQEDVKKVATGDVSQAKNISKDAEGKVKNVAEVKELEKQTAEINKAKGMVPNANKPDEMKELAKKQVMTYAGDQIKGKDAAIKSAMAKMKEYKGKYSDMPSLEQMTKRVRNEMNGKPFVERIVPGLTLQLQKWNTVQLDINPNISYRVSGVWNAGIGWNERISFQKWNKLAPADRIFGPRVFSSVVIKRGFGIKLEVEKMNTWVPQTAVFPDGNKRAWVWSVFAGIRKEYNLTKNIRGNFQTLYNLYDDHSNSPYADKLVVRMGFELPLKKHKKE